MRSQKGSGACVHGFEVRSRSDKGSRPPIERTRFDARIVAVSAPSGVVPRMEPRRRFLERQHSDSTGEQPVQGADQPEGVHRGLRLEMRHLSPRMDAGIRTPGTYHGRARVQDHFQSIFQRFLHRRTIRLDLPSIQIGPVVFDQHPVGGHNRANNQVLVKRVTGMDPTRIYLTGFMASGKSTIGPKVAEALGYQFLDLDEEIERQAGKPVQDIFAQQGEAAFRRLEARLLRETHSQEDIVVSLGGGALTIEDNLVFAKSAGCVIYLRVEMDELMARLLRSSSERPLLRGAGGEKLDAPELRRKVEAMLALRDPFYTRAHLIVQIGGGSVEETTQSVLQQLQRQPAR